MINGYASTCCQALDYQSARVVVYSADRGIRRRWMVAIDAAER